MSFSNPLTRRHGGLVANLAKASLPEEALARVPPEKILENINHYLSQSTSRLSEKLRRILEVLAFVPVPIDKRFSEKELAGDGPLRPLDRKSTRLNSSHIQKSRMPSSA